MRIKKVFIYLLIFSVFALSLNAIKNTSIQKSLVSLSEDIETLSESVKNISVYGISEDAKRKYDAAFVRTVIEEEIKENGSFTLVDRSTLKDSLEEISLSTTGVIDMASIKEAGKISGVDAFVFAYPVTSGAFGKRFTILVKAVDVATGAVIFVEEYFYEERNFFNLGVGLNLSPIATIDAIGGLVFSNTAYDSFYISTNLKPMILEPQIRVMFNIPKINLGIWAEFGMSELKQQGSSTTITNFYAANTHYEKTTVYESGVSGARIGGGLMLPISYWFGDKRDIARIILGYNAGIFQTGGPEGVTIRLLNPDPYGGSCHNRNRSDNSRYDSWRNGVCLNKQYFPYMV